MKFVLRAMIQSQYLNALVVLCIVKRWCRTCGAHACIYTHTYTHTHRHTHKHTHPHTYTQNSEFYWYEQILAQKIRQMFRFDQNLIIYCTPEELNVQAMLFYCTYITALYSLYCINKLYISCDYRKFARILLTQFLCIIP